MGLDYALVHLKFTIPPAIALTLLYRPLFSPRDVYRIIFLITIAVTSTIPWDSYLIRRGIWSYPADAVLGPTIFDIPLEELFFFFIQTYAVSLTYIIYTKADFYPAYLQTSTFLRNLSNVAVGKSLVGTLGQIVIFLSVVQGWALVTKAGPGTYLGLIIVWAFPFMLLLWSLSHTFMLRIPISNILVPVLLPTFYLWMVDTVSLQRGTWVIESGTKIEFELWRGLDIEEAVFFLATNIMIVFGQIAFDHAVATLDAFPDTFPTVAACPSPLAAMKSLFLPLSTFDSNRVIAFSDAMHRLKKKSRSFYLASSMFDGRLRIDLVLLYSFCRVADDLIDNAKDEKEASAWIERLRSFLDIAYASRAPNARSQKADEYIERTFPEETRYALRYLPVHILSKEPLYDLLKGFEMDLTFSGPSQQPISGESELELYGKYVAGTVAELCCDLVFFHYGASVSANERRKLKQAALNMGKALQIVNIARDIAVDASLGRVYIPTTWLKDFGLTADDVLKDPAQLKVYQLRSRFLNKAFGIYDQARPAIEELPRAARGPMRVAIESYMEIGRVLRQETYQVKAGRATVHPARRILVAWKAINR